MGSPTSMASPHLAKKFAVFLLLSAGTACAQSIDYTRDIQPILASRCYSCHGPDEAESGVRFDDRESVIAEAESGEFPIVPGDAEASEMLVRVLLEDDDYSRMPPEGDALTEAQIEALRKWINEGAPYKQHWAYEPVASVAVPQGHHENPIDNFVQASLDQVDLPMNGAADRRTLIRRVTYDLTGLPPSFEEIEAFCQSEDPFAYEKLVDRLLDSRQYGEKWGRHWLDLVRYAETNSFERDGAKPNAWKYRDYVIRSFNEDKPYDQFIREQLAGDELDEVTKETLTATGYYRLGIWDDEPADMLQARYDELDDIIATTGQALLGTTLNCARCHDHKIDPIKQRDYYAMVAAISDVTTWGTRRDQKSNNQLDVSDPGLIDKYRQSDERIASIEAQMREIEQAAIVQMPAPDQRATEGRPKERKRVLDAKLREYVDDETFKGYTRLKDELRAANDNRKQLPPRESIMALARVHERPEQTFVLYRGSPHSPTDPVEPGVPEILAGSAETATLEDNPFDLETPWIKRRAVGRRKQLADWITSPENPMTARVMVNRIWQHHFGRGIVASTNNFGLMATPPTHPELLDWLAIKFVAGGWRFKSMHRMIVLSKTYQQTSTISDDHVRLDAQNLLLGGFPMRRLDAEELRDTMLAVSGQLNLQSYGPSIYPELSREVLLSQSKPGQGWYPSAPDQQNRRSVYVHVKRSLIMPMMAEFDFPDPDSSCEGRFKTLGPGQALALINGEFARNCASVIAEDLGGEASDEFVSMAIQKTMGREATQFDQEEAKRLITELEQHPGVDEQRARQLYVLSLLNRNEFLFLD
ncbi:MAG: PSD1 and planctomycete cytochrome C domain-containing protein [Planctomycetota bacterium]